MNKRIKFILSLVLCMSCIAACTTPAPSLPISPSPNVTAASTATATTDTNVVDFPLPIDDRVIQLARSTPEIKQVALQDYQDDEFHFTSLEYQYPDLDYQIYYNLVESEDVGATDEITFTRIKHDGSTHSTTATIPAHYRFLSFYCTDHYWFYTITSNDVIHMLIRVPLDGGEEQIVHAKDNYASYQFLYHAQDFLYYFYIFRENFDPLVEDSYDFTYQLIQHDLITGEEIILDEFQSHDSFEKPNHNIANNESIFVYGLSNYGVKPDSLIIYNADTKQKAEYRMPRNSFLTIGGFDGRYVSMHISYERLEVWGSYYIIFDTRENRYYACPSIASEEEYYRERYYSNYLWHFDSGILSIVEASGQQLFYRKYTLDQTSPIVSNTYFLSKKIPQDFRPFFLPNPDRIIIEGITYSDITGSDITGSYQINYFWMPLE